MTETATARPGSSSRGLAKRTPLDLSMVVAATGYTHVQVALIRHTMAGGLGVKAEDVPFVDVAMYCQAMVSLGLNPLVRQAYWIKRNGKGTLQIGIDGFRAIADRAGNYAGSSEPIFRGTIEWEHRGRKLIVPDYCQVTVWKIVAGHKCAFTGEARWMEYVAKAAGASAESDMWAKMPRNQLAKCAEAQALRKGWALQLGGVPLRAEDPAEADLPEVAAPQRTVEQVQPAQRSAYAGYEELARHHFPGEFEDAPEPDEGPPEEDAEEPRERENLMQNAKLLHAAQVLHASGLGKLKAEASWTDAQIETANKALEDKIREKNGDAKVAAEQDRIL